MKTIFVVHLNEAERARRMEKKLLSLPEESGILFASVEVHEAPKGIPGPFYKIFIGCSREREISLMHSIIKRYLRDEVISETQLVVEAHRGHDKTTILD